MADLLLDDFSGGVANRQPAERLGADQLQAAINVLLRDGYVKGADNLSNFATGVSNTIQSLAAVTTGTPTVLQFSDADVAGAEVNGWFYYASPAFTTRPQKRRLSDGLTQSLGIVAPVTAPSVSAGSGTLTLTNATYVYTLLNDLDGAESPPSPLSTPINLAGQGAILGTVSSGDSQVTSIQWYRLTAGSYLQLPVTVPIGSYTVDSFATTSLGAALRSTNWDAPGDGMDGIATAAFNGMLFAWKGAYVYWSVDGKPNAWDASYFRKYPYDVKRVVVMGDRGVVVLTEKTTHILTGSGPTALVNQDIDMTMGCVHGPSAVYAAGKGVHWISAYGLVRFNGGEIEKLSRFRVTDLYGASAKAAYADDVYTLFQSGAITRFDMFQDISISSVSHVQTTVDGCTAGASSVFYLKDNGATKQIVEIGPAAAGSPISLTYTITTRALSASAANHRIKTRRISVDYSGTCTVQMYANGELIHTKACPEKASRGRFRYLGPHSRRGERIHFTVTGTGTLYHVGLEQAVEERLP